MEPRIENDTLKSAEDKARDPATLSFIDRISWFERERPMTADNDNAQDSEDSACFQSWALPDFLRK